MVTAVLRVSNCNDNKYSPVNINLWSIELIEVTSTVSLSLQFTCFSLSLFHETIFESHSSNIATYMHSDARAILPKLTRQQSVTYCAILTLPLSLSLLHRTIRFFSFHTFRLKFSENNSPFPLFYFQPLFTHLLAQSLTQAE